MCDIVKLMGCQFILLCSIQNNNKQEVIVTIRKRSLAMAEIAHDVETAIQGHSRSSVVMPIDTS